MQPAADALSWNQAGGRYPPGTCRGWPDEVADEASAGDQRHTSANRRPGIRAGAAGHASARRHRRRRASHGNSADIGFRRTVTGDDYLSLRPDQRGVGEDGRDREATGQPRRQPAERQPHDRHPTRRRRTGQGNLDRRGTDQRQRSGAPAGGARPAHDDEQRQYRDLQPAAAEGGRRGTGDRRPRGPDGADQRRRQ